MSFQPQKKALTANVTANAAAFTDVAGLAMKFTVVQAETLVKLSFQGLLSLSAADRADLRFVVQRDNDATPAFTAFDTPGAQGHQSFHANASTADLLTPVYFERVGTLQSGRYTVKLQHKEGAAGVLTLNGLVANGEPSEIRVQPMSNDAMVATGNDHKHVGGSY